MANARQRIVFGILLVVLGAAVFITASAYVVDHQYSKIAAAILGGFAFPVAPVLWHLIAERRRRTRLANQKGPAKKASLSGIDRFWLRFAVVALAVLGPMFGASRFGVFRSAWRQGLWFVPSSSSSSSSSDLTAIGNAGARDLKEYDALLKRVPSDAELVLIAHQDAEHGKPAVSGVIAWGARQAMLAIDGPLDDGMTADKAAAMFNDNRDKLPFLPIDNELAAVATSDKSTVLATTRWRAKVEPPAGGILDEMRDQLTRAPGNARFVAAFVPRTKLSEADLDVAMIRHGVVWMEPSDTSLVLAGRMEMVDPAAAAKFVAEVNTLLQTKPKDAPDGCRDALVKMAESVKLQQQAAIITMRAELPGKAMLGILGCVIKK